MDEIVVSILCLAYNHAAYIEKTLDGFVHQKTTFCYEVLIHDDASTDGTQDIIRRYAEEYPKIIKPLYQTVNQYRNGGMLNIRFQFPRAQGKYVAICEGDDWWIDDEKLQKQVDYMESHPDCTFCFTNAEFWVGGVSRGPFLPQKRYEKYMKKGSLDYNLGELIRLDFLPTASFLFPTRITRQICSLDPSCFSGDVCMRLLSTMNGYAHYIDETTCVYNYQTPASITSRLKKDNNTRIHMYSRIGNLYRKLNELSGYQYDSDIKRQITMCDYNVLMARGELKPLRARKYFAFAASMGIKSFTVYVMQVYFPGVYERIAASRRAESKNP